MAHAQEARDVALYNGVSNRSRGWKSRRPGEATESPAPQTYRHTNIRRWDGRNKTCTAWDGLRRDPELWFRHGNYFVHLYARGQSRRGPAFRLPMSTLLAAQCHSVVERFVTQSIPVVPTMPPTHDGMVQPWSMPPSLEALDSWSRAHLIGRVDLYIPPPPNTDRDQTFLYYLAIRNLFAWVFRRPVVGEFLGSALVGLDSAMREFRHPQADNVQDLLCYLDDEGYSAMAGHPAYALALLHLAETMQLRALYIDAFSHCVGMYNDLHLGSEYKYISPASRKLVRRARLEMDMRLGSAGSMLSHFLEDQLSETHLGLPEPARAHLERFRTHVQGFYASRLGYYPPVSMDTRSMIFEPYVYRILADDFKALYDFLVDESFTADAIGPALAQGSFCVLQSVKSFDERHGFASLEHPLPLLPDVVPSSQSTGTSSWGVSSRKNGGASRRMSWLGGKSIDRLLLSRTEKLKPDARLVAHAALLKASHKTQADLARNEFVAAYRQFEEDSVFKPYKADRMEKISMIDARKVRWILIYAVHQTLQNCFLPPRAEVHGAGTVTYHMSISPKHLPRWADATEPAPASTTVPTSPTQLASPTSPTTWAAEAPPPVRDDHSRDSYCNDTAPLPRCMSMTAIPDASVLHPRSQMDGHERARALSPVFDIRPDIDYLGLANRRDDSPLEGEVVMLPRSRSLTRSLSQKANFRRSLSLFRANQNHTTSDVRDSAALRPPRLQKSGQPAEGTATRCASSLLPPLPSASMSSSLMQRSSSQSTREKLLQRALGRERRMSSPYHEIVVHGYGNGTNTVQLAVSTDVDAAVVDDKPADSASPADDSVATPSTARSLSTSSTNSATSALTADTALTAVTGSTRRSSVTCPMALPELPADLAVLDAAFVETPVLTRTASQSSSVYSNTSSKATSRVGGNTPTPIAAPEAPAIPPRGPGRGQQTPVLRSNSVYATAPLPIQDCAQGPQHGMDVGKTAMHAAPPPVPVRNSARHRPFSMYGSGDEYAHLHARVRPLVVPQRAVENAALPQKLDMVQEALRAVRETMEQQQMVACRVGGNASVAMSRSSSLVGVSALRSVHEEEDELTALGATAHSLGMASRSKSAPRSRSARHRHSSYIGLRNHADNNDDGVPAVDAVHPEWEKFAMGLGGHTVV